MDVLCQLKLALVTALAHLGLLKPYNREEQEEEEEEGEEGEVIPDPIIIMDGLSPSFVQVPVQTLTAMIKSQVPVVEYARFLERRGCRGEGDGGGGGGCAVCLSSIEGRDEVRELSSCSHAFHRECLDRWVDHNQVTCPVCRSLLLPSNWDRTVTSCFPREDDGGI
ncbi:probable E3 ubiquitin-protein ligase RHA1A [Eucalyptus grandis]|uniref:probable E3 ubiquitin-protein ligase RHA1A n=1 Tax=Eucalyptus grandis TaxID=71139 RepID=UPI00192E766A|nr:probable E3 ubiquitin-protein ligase RHA1A [Eucalyptus grandis]